MHRDDKSKRLIFVIDSGAVKVNSGFSNKLKVNQSKNSIILPLVDEGKLEQFCVKVKTDDDAKDLKEAIEKAFNSSVCFYSTVHRGNLANFNVHLTGFFNTERYALLQ